MRTVIRPAQVTDRSEITRLHIEVGASTYRGMMSDHYLDVLRPEEKTQLWAQRMAGGIDAEKYTLLVAEQQNALIGFIFFALVDEQEFGTYLHHLYIAPSHQGKRLGLHLLVDGITALPSDRHDLPVHLVALAENQRAVGFYEKLGGRVIEEILRNQDHGPDIALARYQWTSAADLAHRARVRLRN